MEDYTPCSSVSVRSTAPLLRVVRPPCSKENAVDLPAHSAYGVLTSFVVEELRRQPAMRPTSDAERAATRTG
jgi:hypothetical protein